MNPLPEGLPMIRAFYDSRALFAFDLVEEVTGYPLRKLRGPSKLKCLVRARWVVALLLHDADWTPHEIAIALRRDRTTVLHGLTKIESDPVAKVLYEMTKADVRRVGKAA